MVTKIQAFIMKSKQFYILFFLITFFGWSYIHGQNCNVSLGPNQYVCNNINSTPVTANNVSGFGNNPNYNWTVNGNNVNGNNSITIQFNNNSPNPQVVICEVTSSNNNNNCLALDTLLIYSINPGTISGNQYVCNGSIPNLLTSSNAGSTNYPNTTYSYQWQSASNSNGPWTNITNETNATFSPSPVQTTTYYRREFTLTVNGVDYTCNSNNIAITNINPPTINNPLCVNLNSVANLSLTFNPSLPNGVSATYAWTGPNNFTSASSSPNVSNVTAIKTGTYNVSVAIVSNGNTICTYQLSTTVNVNPPVPTFSMPSNGCQGNSYIPTNFTPQPNTSYQWSISPQTGSGGSTGLTTANPNFVFNNVGTYAITVTATLNGCSTTSNAQNISMSNFNIDPPSVELNGTYYNVQVINGQNTIAICAGLSNTNINILNNNISPNCSGGSCNPSGVTYTFSINNSNPVPFGSQVSGTINYGNNIFVITATLSGCTMTYTGNIYSGSNPFVSIGTNNSIGLCPGNSINFSINPVTPTGQTNPPGTTYTVLFNDAPGAISTLQNITAVTTISHTYNTTSCGMVYTNSSQNNTFYAQVTAQNLCGQTISSVSPITVNALPSANFTVSDSTICVNQTITVTNTGNAGSVIGNTFPYNCSAQGKFYWTISGGALGTNFTIPGTQTLGFINTNYGNFNGNGSPVLNVTFLTAGYYTITQYYYNSCGSVARVRNICVINPAICQFTTNPTSGCSPLTVNTNNTSTAPTCNGSSVPLGYVWTVSNQGVNTSSVISAPNTQNPTITLSNNTTTPQVFTISLNVIPMEPAAPTIPFSNTLLFCSTPISGNPTVTSITGANSPWPAVISGLSGTTGIPAGTFIMATNGSGSIGTGGVYSVTSSTASSINYTATGGNMPMLGTVTGLYRAISGTVSSPTVTGNGVWTSTISGLCSTNGITVGSVIYATNVGGGSIGSGGIYTVSSVTSSSITYTATGGTAPTAGTITNLSVTSCTALCTQTVIVNPIPILTPLNITSCSSPYTTNINLQNQTNMASTFSWIALDNVNVTGESITQQNTSSIQDVLTNQSNSSQTISYSITPTSTPPVAPGCVGATQPITVLLNFISPGVISSDQTICAGGNPLNLTGTSPSAIGTLSYQWQSSTSPNGPWSNISGATLSSYDPPVTSSTIYYQRIVNYLSNGVNCQGISNMITITVNTISAGTISAAQTICQGGDPALISVATNPTGSGILTYQWQSSTSSSTTGFSNIGSQITSSYDPPVLNVNTWYQLITTSTLNGIPCSATSAPILITVVTLNAGSVATNQTICIGGDPAAFTSVAATTNNGASIAYQWQSSLDNSTWTNIVNATGATYDPPVQNDTIWFRRLVTTSLGGNVICSGVSNTLMITVINDPIITTPPLAAQNICQGGSVAAFNFVFSGGTGTPSYQWYSVSSTGAYSPISGATSPTYTPLIFNTPGIFNYVVLVNQNVSGCSSGYSPTAQVTVVADPTITNPSPAAYCQNSASVVPLSVTASGGISSLTYSYQWYSNTANNTTTGTLIPGATSSTFTPSVTTVTNLYYYCIVTQPTGLGCAVTSATALISVTANPTITTQPLTSQTICIGGNTTTLTLTSSGGSGAPSYQWYVNTTNSNSNGVLILNATNQTYSPPISSTPDTAYYYCIISFNNTTGCSVAVSNPATVMFIADPTISVPPASQTICLGGTISPALTVSILGGSGNASYQWYTVSGSGVATAISNATASTYTPLAFNTVGTYNYSVVVNQNVSGCSTGQSSTATITVVSEIVVSPTVGATYCQNAANVTALSVTASGGNGNSYTYQWYSTVSNNNSSGSAISGANSPTYTPPVTAVNTTYYYCVVSQTPSQNSCATNSTQAGIIVNAGPTFSTQPNPLQSVCVNGALSPLTVVVSGGNGIPSYQWYVNSTNNNTTGTAIPNAINASYTLPAATQVGTNYYYCIITFSGNSGCSSVISNLAAVTISNGPSITTPPLATQTICVGGTISPALTVSISGGSGNPLYQWYTVSGSTYLPITNATTGSYTPPVFNTAGNYNYAVLVNQSSGGCSTGYSTNATVVVVADPTLSAPATPTSYCQNAGNVTALSVTASGGNNTAYSYQWYSNSVASTTNSTLIPNATNSTYTPSVSSTGTLYYYCVVTQGTGIGCSFASSFANVTVTSGPNITTQPLATQTLCIGGTVSALNVVFSGGSGGATYQWYSNSTNSTSNGTLITGATAATFTPLVSNSQGLYYYYCIISFNNTSGCSVITSNVAIVDVLADPIISTAPLATQTICLGGTISPALTVAITGGSGNATYQWYTVSGTTYTAISGATGTNYTPPVFNTPGNYNYSVIVNQSVSGCSSGQSSNALVTVIADPIGSSPTAATYCQNAGTVNQLSVNASGGNGNGYLYQWYSTAVNNNTSGNAIPGATGSTFTPPVSNIGVTYYYCLISQAPTLNNCASNTSQAAITVTNAPIFSTQPIPTQTVCLNGPISTLTVAYSNGSGVPSYQWYVNTVNSNVGGSSISGATNSSYPPTSTAVGTSYYYCVLTFAQSGCSTITSNVAAVNVNPGPTISSQPTPTQTLCVGGNLGSPLSVTFTNGVGTSSYQWYLVNGGTNTPIANATTSTYTPPQFNTAGTFNYMVQITLNGGGCGSIQSNQAQVIVVSDPTSTAPTAASYCNGYSPVTPLSITASGGNPNSSYTYQWFSNTSNNSTTGNVITGATSSTYTPPVSSNGTVYYYCIINQPTLNSGCQNNSVPAAIIVTASPTVNTQPIPTQTACIGGTLNSLSFTYTGGNSTPTYQWYSNSVNSTVGSTPIGGANAATYLPLSNLAGTNYYYCVITFTGIACSTINTSIVSVLIQPDPSITVQPISSQAVCTGTTISIPLSINYTGGFGTPSYQWNTVSGSNNTAISGATTATYTPPTFTQAGTYNFSLSITLSGNGCNAMTSANAQIIVSPVPTVNAISSVTYCNADVTPVIPFSGTVTGSSFIWQNSNANIGLASSGSGNLPSFVAANTSPAAIVGTITVTPQLITLGTTCSGTNGTFTITINPYQNVNDPQDLVLCHGTGVNGVQFSGTSAINNWTNDLPALGIGSSGSGTLPAFLATNNGTVPIVANLSVTPSFNGLTTCPGDIETFTITILPAPTVTVLPGQTICNGSNTNTLNFSGTATSYNWSNSQPSIGLSSSGSGNIVSFLAINTSGSNIVANISAVPIYTLNNFSCTGAAQITQLTILPLATLNPVANFSICNGNATGIVNFNGNASSYTWTCNNTAIGLASSGVGPVPSFTAINSGITAVNAIISVIPINTFNGVNCPAPQQNFTITVNPSPILSVNSGSICSGQSFALTGTASVPGGVYSWNTGGNLQTINVSPLTTETYTLNYSTNAGCTALAATGTVTVLPVPTITATSANICAGQSATLTATSNIPGGVFSWNPGGLSGNSITVNPNSTTSYSVNYISSVGCAANNISSTLTVNPVAILSVNSTSICSGNAATLTATVSIPGGTFLWNNGATTQTLTLNPSISTTNTVNYTTSAGCASSPASGTITILPLPILQPINDTTICNSSNISIGLNANLSSTFTWGAASNVSVNGESIGPVNSNLIFNALQNLTNNIQTVVYTVTPSSVPFGCVGNSVNFSVDIVPDIVLTSPTTYAICSGEPTGIYLQSNLPAAFTWQATNNANVQGEITSLQNGFYINDFLVNTTSYDQVVNYLINQTSSTYSCFGIPSVVSVTVHPQINLTNSDTIIVCSGDNIGLNLAATTNSTFVWSANNNGLVTGESLSPQTTDIIDDILVNNSTAQQQVNYTIDVTSNNNGCSVLNLPVTVFVNPLPLMLNQDTSICSGQSVNMNISTSIPSTVVWYGLINPIIYGETTTNTYTSTINDVLVNSSANIGFVEYVVTASANGCFAPNDTVQVNVLVPPTVSFTVNTNPLCSDAPISFVNQSPPTALFSWSFGDGTNSTTYSPSHSYLNSGNYLVVLEATNQNNNCSASDSLLIAVNKSPDATFYTNDTTGCGDLNATFFAFYQPGVDYLWDFGNGETSTQVGNVTNYYDTEGCYNITLALTSPEGCISQLTQSNYVCLYDYPIAIISADPLVVNSLETQVNFYNSSQNAISYLWNLGNGVLSYDDNPTYTFPNWAADYNVLLTAFNEIGCTDTASISIHVIEDLIVYAPNTFTPNDDEINQVYLPVLAQGYKKDYFEMYIYNRWGDLIFESHDPLIGWDGSYGRNSINCEIGTYTWVIKVEALSTQEIEEFTGHVNLVR